jgi:chorismate mutase
MADELSLRAYARSRRERCLPGGSLQAVRKAVLSNRISLTAAGKIDPAQADVAWAANTPARPRRVVDPPREERLLAAVRATGRHLGFDPAEIDRLIATLRLAF